MLEFLIVLMGITLVAVAAHLTIRLFVIKPGQVSKIQHFIEDGKLDEALIYITMRLRRNPKDVVLSYWMGEVCWLLGRKDQAIRIFEDIDMAQLRPHRSYMAQTLYRLGAWYCETGNLEHSERCFNELKKLRVENADHSHSHALLAVKMEKLPLAVTLLEEALHGDPGHEESLLTLGQVYGDLKDYNGAYAALSRLVQLRPEDPEIWLRLGDICFKAENNSKAVKFYNKAETFPNPFTRFEAMCGLSQLYRRTGEVFQSIQSLSKAIAYAKPEFCSRSLLLELYYELAESYLSAEETDQAFAQWEIIMKLNPDYRDVSEKYTEFFHLRLSEFFKDLLTLNSKQLADRVIEFVKKLGLVVEQYAEADENSVDVLTGASSSRWGSDRKEKTLFSFWCSSDPLPLAQADNLRFRQNTAKADRVILISAGPVLSEARELLSRRNVFLYDIENIHLLSDHIKSPPALEPAFEE